jgi:3'-5' exoribonuclease
MEYDKPIADMIPGDEVEGFYILKDAHQKTTAAGKPFLSGSIADRSGSMDIKVWDYSGPVGGTPSDTGKVIKLRGVVSEFKGMPQLTVSRIRMTAPADRYDTAALVPVAPIDPDEALNDIRRMLDSLTDADYRAAAKTMLQRHLEAFRQIPAAKSVHHSFLSGLLMHTSNMLKMADFLAGLYAEIIDRSLLLTGTLLHDFAKEREFVFSDLGIVTDYSTKGQLLGHLVMGAQEAAEVCSEVGVPEEKSVLLQHLILSHHGEPEFGAAVRPMCAEAELLSYIDLIDSRMEIYAENLPDVPVGTFSNRIFSLDKKIYHHG